MKELAHRAFRLKKRQSPATSSSTSSFAVRFRKWSANSSTKTSPAADPRIKSPRLALC